MEWLPIDRENIPDGEVLVANFNKGSYGYKEKIIGYVNDAFCCENLHQSLDGCTHYIRLSDYDL